MLNLSTQGLKAQITQWIARIGELREMLSTVTDMYGDLVGIDLDDSSILSISLHHTVGVARVVHAEAIELPVGAVVDNSIIDNVAVVAVVKKMLEKANLQTTNTAIALPGSKVVIKQIKLDLKLSDSDVEARAWQEARRSFPDIVKSLYLDFSQLEEIDRDKNKKYSIVMVAARKEDMMPRVDALSQAGLSTKIVDVDYYALERVYSLLASQLSEDHVEKHVAMIDFNPHNIVFIVMHKKKMIYYNCQNYVGDALLPIVQKIMGFTVSVPVKAKSVSLPSLQPLPSLQIPPPAVESTVDITALDDEKKTHIVMSIRRLFQSFYAEKTGKTIDCILMTGRCALITEMAQHVGKALDTPLVVGNPLLSLKISEKLDGEKLLKLGPAFALSCGLAMRGIPV
ncbi:MAG TPA: type IV pilus assembly protein PilM [Coxiellaceae bacterium]|nr:type IV pilus assembly protein PilM [Coxiellaceae bacterium]